MGPFRAGRVTAVSGHPVDRNVFYFGACAGGVWKTLDGGLSWRNVTDGYLDSSAVGAIAVAPSDPNVVWVGMGEACIRSNVYGGDGVYRTTDGGRTWRHLGLSDTHHIGRVVVHPTDPDTAYVAALGHAFGPNEERGVYRTTDGGRTFERVLFEDADTGAVSLTMDPENPRILYASFWQARRTPHGLTSGGPGSGLWRTDDGGDTWQRLTGGLPAGLLGRIGLSHSARSGRVYATIEALEGGIFRTDDYGATWQRVTDNADLRQRPWYFNHLTADPVDPDTVYATNFKLWRSIDGGRTFTELPAAHPDHHDMWIDPVDPTRLINGHDGGAAVSYDHGRTWSSVMNQPTAQFYHVTTDTRTPYRIYGAQQDNTTLSVPSRSRFPGITNAESYAVGGGESGYIAVRPDDPDIVYAGSNGSLMTRYDHRTGQRQVVTPWPEEVSGYGSGELRYRFQWTFPIVISPHDPKTLYACAQVVFRSRDEGQSWQAISPDLTRAVPETMIASGGPITKDNTGAEAYATVFALAESPVVAGVLWAGSDDGRVHVSRDHGANWTDVTPPAMPDFTLVSIIEASRHDAAVAYVVGNRYKADDPRPFVYRTADYGATWQEATGGLGNTDSTRSLREDPEVAGLVYLATDRGVYVSFDSGAHWQSLRNNLPLVPVHDLAVHGDDLVAATHGRAFWLFEDLRLVRRAARGESGVALDVAPVVERRRQQWGYAERSGPYGYVQIPSGVLHWERESGPDGDRLAFVDAGENPPEGAALTFVLPADDSAARLGVYDAGGTLVKEWRAGADKPADRLGSSAGGHRAVWNLRYPDPALMDGVVYRGGDPRGPLAPPGSYTAVLEAAGGRQEVRFQLASDPGVTASDEDLRAQSAFQKTVADRLEDCHGAIGQIRELKAEMALWRTRLERAHGGADGRLGAIDAAVASLSAIEGRLVQVNAKSPKDLLNFPLQLNVKLASLLNHLADADAAPTAQDRAVFEHLSAACQAEFDQLKAVVRDQVLPLSAQLAEAGLAPLTVADTWR